MEDQKLVIVTGAAGFIGSVLVTALNNKGYKNLVLVDDFSRRDKAANLLNKQYEFKVHRDQFHDWAKIHITQIAAIFHIGAKTDTTIRDIELFKKMNIDYTRSLFELCTEHNIPFLYASSAATYGNGENGYIDDESLIDSLKPLNAYAKSKNEIDKWILTQKEKPRHWYGFKFFNVYGPNEYHKGRMASVVFHAYKEILASGYVTLFRSHNSDFEDGKQMRDFIYVKDVAEILIFFLEHLPKNGIFNVGTGEARTFLDLAHSLFDAINHEGKIRFIDTPESIRQNYQYYTQADTNKLREAGYSHAFTSLEDGVRDYAANYLEAAKYL